eukprot:GEMP01030761.1.p1 GENE.GEMP01030761.1~~GEMP01030761.1.p1  ORF type:complete len:249 (+),score=61.03 GEMP01030761.1:149-895(+)
MQPKQMNRHLADTEWIARGRHQRISHLLRYRALPSHNGSPKPLSPSHKMRPASSLQMTGCSTLERSRSSPSMAGTSLSVIQTPGTGSMTPKTPHKHAMGGSTNDSPGYGSKSLPNLDPGQTPSSTGTLSLERPKSTSTLASRSTRTTSLSMMVRRAMMSISERDAETNRSQRPEEMWYVDNAEMGKGDLQQLCDHLTKCLSKERRRRRKAEDVLKDSGMERKNNSGHKGERRMNGEHDTDSITSKHGN